MAQEYEKYELDNQGGQSFREKLNKILADAVSQNAGPDAPDSAAGGDNTSYAYQVWVDTNALGGSGTVVKIRDAATAGTWYSLYKTDANGQPTGAVATGSYSISTNDTTGTGGTTAITVDTSQRVGINTASPDNPLHVAGAGTIARLESSTTTSALRFENSAASDGYVRYVNQDLQFIAADSLAATIDSSGNVGIGATTVDEHLHVEGSGTQRVKIQSTNTGVSGVVMMNTNRRYDVQVNGSDLQIYDNTGSTERARIDSSGRLLVGTPSVLGGTANNGYYALLAIRGNTAGSDLEGRLVLATDKAHTSVSSGTDIGGIWFTDGQGGDYAYIRAQGDGTAGTNDFPGRLAFYTTADSASSPTERMRITSAGDITSLLGPYNNTIATGVNLHITSAGTLKRVTSSAKYKTNIETLEDSYADNILNCRPVWYRALNDEEHPEYSWYGFIAEEVAEIDPRLVQYREVEITYDEDGNSVSTPLAEPEPEGVSYERFVPHLVNLIKRQQARIETLETQNAEQATTIASFEARISALEGGN